MALFVQAMLPRLGDAGVRSTSPTSCLAYLVHALDAMARCAPKEWVATPLGARWLRRFLHLIFSSPAVAMAWLLPATSMLLRPDHVQAPESHLLALTWQDTQRKPIVRARAFMALESVLRHSATAATALPAVASHVLFGLADPDAGVREAVLNCAHTALSRLAASSDPSSTGRRGHTVEGLLLSPGLLGWDAAQAVMATPNHPALRAVLAAVQACRHEFELDAGFLPRFLADALSDRLPQESSTNPAPQALHDSVRPSARALVLTAAALLQPPTLQLAALVALTRIPGEQALPVLAPFVQHLLTIATPAILAHHHHHHHVQSAALVPSHAALLLQVLLPWLLAPTQGTPPPACLPPLLFSALAVPHALSVSPDARETVCPAQLALDALDEPVVACLSSHDYERLFRCLCNLLHAGSPDIVASCRRAWRRIPLRLDMMQRHFHVLTSAPATASAAVPEHAPALDPHLFDEDDVRSALGQWLPRLEVLLEVLQLQAGAPAEHELMPAMFSLLRSLSEPGVAVATATASDYLRQVLLGALMRQCRARASAGATAQGSTIAEDDVGLLLHYVRDAPTPQTRTAALMALGALAELQPDRLLHTVLAAMAALRQGRAAALEDALTVRVLQQLIDTVVPVLCQHLADCVARRAADTKLLRALADLLDAVPEASRQPLMRSMVVALGEQALPTCLAVLLGRAAQKLQHDAGLPAHYAKEQLHAALARQHTRRRSNAGSSKPMDGPALIRFAHELAVLVSPHGQAQAVADLLCAAQALPLTGASADASGSTEALTTEGGGPISGAALLTECSSAPRMGLRVCLEFVAKHLQEPQFLSGVLDLNEAGDRELQGDLLACCQQLFALLRVVSSAQAARRDPAAGAAAPGALPTSAEARFWDAVAEWAFEVQSTVNQLLSVPGFIAVIDTLLHHEEPSIRRRALQLFNAKVKEDAEELSPSQVLLFLDMLGDLHSILRQPPAARAPAPREPDSVRLAKRRRREPVAAPALAVAHAGSDADAEAGAVEDAEAAAADAVNRQVALLSVHILAGAFGRMHPQPFLRVLPTVVALAVQPLERANKQLLSSAFVCLATLCTALGEQVFPHLPRFFPALLDALEWAGSTMARVRVRQAGHAGKDSLAGVNVRAGDLAADSGDDAAACSLMLQSALMSLSVVIGRLPQFLSPYLPRILLAVLQVEVLRTRQPEIMALTGRVLSLLATRVEARVALPAMFAAVDACAARDDACLARLFQVLSACVGGMDRATVRQHYERVFHFFLNTFQARAARGFAAQGATLSPGASPARAVARSGEAVSRLLEQHEARTHVAAGVADTDTADADAADTAADAHMTASFLALVMKLSETQLKPLFLKLCQWATAPSEAEGVSSLGLPLAVETELTRRLVFFRVVDALAGKLRSIFSPYLSYIVPECVEVLQHAVQPPPPPAAASMTAGTAQPAARAGMKRRRGASPAADVLAAQPSADAAHRTLRHVLACFVVSSLRKCFEFDPTGALTAQHVDSLLAPLVRQLEHVDVAGGAEEYDAYVAELVVPCLARLASATGKDAVWKPLHHAVLMQTRSAQPRVRRAALQAVLECFLRVGEEYVVMMLPETMPFLAELLEDDDAAVEGLAHEVKQVVERMTGESIDSYLTA